MNEFLTSETLRAFYKTAKKKGWVKENKVVKKASGKDISLVPSNDLFRDICVLADGLRAKGYVKQAEDLEQKAIQYKIAETHLYKAHEEDGEDLLNTAHPDGDYKVTDSQYGIVETTMSANKKILDIVNKGPKGKLAAIADEIKKKAQDVKFEGWIGSQSPADDGVIRNLLSGVARYLQAIKESIGTADNYTFDLDALISSYISGGNAYSNVFESLAGEEIAQDIKNYIELRNRVYGNAERTPKTILNNIKNAISGFTIRFDESKQASLLNYFNSIAPGRFDNFANPNFQNSVWTEKMGGYSFDDKKAANVANEIHNYVVSQRNAININVANSQVKSFINRIISGLNSIEVPTTIQLSDKGGSFNKALADQGLAYIGDLYRKFESVLNNETLSVLKTLMDAFGYKYSLTHKYRNEFVMHLNSVYKNIADKVKDLFVGPQADAIAHRFVKAKELLYQFIMDYPDHPQIENYKGNYKRSEILASALKELKGRSYSTIREHLKKKNAIGEDFPTISDLDRFSQEWLTAVRAGVGAQ